MSNVMHLFLRYYLSIMLIQMFNLFACKCKNKIPFGPYLFANKYTFLSVLGGAGFAILIVYVPPFNGKVEHWFMFFFI